MGILTTKGKQFLLDGKPFTVISGAMHYFRIPNEYWYDRLLKLKECGFNTVETYTCWNLHEPKEGEFDFYGDLDVVKFIEVATELGLYIILRPGPFICAEWEFGGFPAWLLKYKDIELRCYNELYLSKVRNYFAELLGRIRPYLAVNGGNIFMLQVENEYGSYGNDKEYLREILKIYSENDIDCLFFTSDGHNDSFLTGGTLPECICVANFGSKPKEKLANLEKFRPDQPLMCGEYWSGWFEHWGDNCHHRPQDEVVSDFKDFLDMDASLNYYMFHGGTNFGFNNGANYTDCIQPTITSYDYGAPLSEAGDRTETYYRLRELLVEKFGDKVPKITATETLKAAYGKVKLTEKADLFCNLENISKPIRSVAPLFMEEVDQSYGYILYRAIHKGPFDEWPFYIDCVRDRAQIFVDGEYKATYLRDKKVTADEAIRVPLKVGETAQLDILVENQGHINYGPFMYDPKGMKGARFSNQRIFGWDIYPLPMIDLSGLRFEPISEKTVTKPTFLRGQLTIDGEPKDTFIRLDGFKKGFVMINGFNLGRYYEAGPQKTLYVPAPRLKQGENEIIVFESDGTDSLTVEFFAQPDLG